MTQTDFKILMLRAESAASIQHELTKLQVALSWLKCSAFHFTLGDAAFSEVEPGFRLPQETWDKLRAEITSAIQSRIKELQQQFKEL